LTEQVGVFEAFIAAATPTLSQNQDIAFEKGYGAQDDAQVPW